MKIATAVPYRRTTVSRIDFSEWLVSSADVPSSLPAVLCGLDYYATLHLRREMIVDVAGIRSDCGLAAHVPIVVAASWSSPGTMLRRSLAKTPITCGNSSCVVEVAGIIVGGDVAGVLNLDTTILVASRQDSGDPLSAKHAGSILFQERQSVQLDMTQSFFPVEIVDFRKGSWANAEAGWRLSWNIFALEQPFLGSVRLLINAAHPKIVHAVCGDRPTSEAFAIRSAIYFDTAKTLILGALGSEEFIQCGGMYAEGSCGKVIFSMIEMLFPGDGLGGLAAAATQRPEHFSSDLQGRLRLFWGSK
jgi:hypothetical protein